MDARARFVLGRPEDYNNILHAVREGKPEAIMHFAANALVGESMTNPGKSFHNNVANGLKLLDAAVECGVRSSSSALPARPTAARPPADDRDLPQRPINPYGESKLMFEKMLQWYQRIHGLEFIVFATSMPPGRASASASIIASSRTSSRTCCR